MNEDLSIYHTPLPLTTLHLSWAAPFVLNVTLNRPEVRNAISDAFWAEFKQVFETVAEDGNVRCIMGGSPCLFRSVSTDLNLPFYQRVLTAILVSTASPLVSGNGPLFCAGIDLKARGNRVAPKDQGRKMFNHRRRVMITSVAAFQAME
jgi:enoyl-CoA hydratase/carnithine racemase